MAERNNFDDLPPDNEQDSKLDDKSMAQQSTYIRNFTIQGMLSRNDIDLKKSEAPGEASDGELWTTGGGKHNYGAAGTASIVLIAPDVDTSNPEIVARRPRSELTEEETRKLEHQGIAEEHHHSDLAIMRARYEMDKDYQVAEELTGAVTGDQVIKKITTLMNNTDNYGVTIHYIGPGRRGTGDWCFSDGFITFEDLMEIYGQQFRGKILRIVMDSSYSGCWVKQAMVLIDDYGVGPCGHAAKEKHLLIKVITSCQANEIPAELAFSANTVINDKNTGEFIGYRNNDAINEHQHPCGVDFTQVKCKAKIDRPCTMVPGATWDQWERAQRTYLVRGEDRGQPAWHYVLLADDEETITLFHEKLASGSFNVADYGQILKSGWGKDPPDDVVESIQRQYAINYDYKQPQ